MAYEPYYRPTIQGRGEFVRPALEEAGVPYQDVGRLGNGAVEAVLAVNPAGRETEGRRWTGRMKKALIAGWK